MKQLNSNTYNSEALTALSIYSGIKQLKMQGQKRTCDCPQHVFPHRP